MSEMTNSNNSFSYDQAVVITIGTKHYTKAYDLIKKIENETIRVLPENSGLDGDEFSDDDAIIYYYGPSADEIFNAIKHILTDSDFKDINVNLQYGQADAPNLKEKYLNL
ncbi:TPA: hypothetical protein DIV49_02200 [Candidatus Saccharibacteria bacterium]|nr:hypothetical protein [Candidatus Saccharibacteria bacterium]